MGRAKTQVTFGALSVNEDVTEEDLEKALQHVRSREASKSAAETVANNLNGKFESVSALVAKLREIYSAAGALDGRDVEYITNLQIRVKFHADRRPVIDILNKISIDNEADPFEVLYERTEHSTELVLNEPIGADRLARFEDIYTSDLDSPAILSQLFREGDVAHLVPGIDSIYRDLENISDALGTLDEDDIESFLAGYGLN